MKKSKNKIKNIYLPLICIATFFMCIGYAQIGDVALNITGLAQGYVQDGVFITDVIYKSNVNANTTNSKINLTTETMIDSQIVLGNTEDSSITYQVNMYNNTESEYMFIGILTDDSLYSNENIEISLNQEEIEEYVTTILPKKTLQFTITFKYTEDADLTKNTLTSKLNFRFQEVPTLILSNESEKYTLNNIYPNYTPQEYTFTVSNYNNTKTNNVPMTYKFETTINSPLTIKIYDELGNEVTEGISITGNGTDQINHTYTIKVIWDNSNPEDGKSYNSYEYANKNYLANIKLIATPDSEKYLNYNIIKEFNIDINTSSFNFNIDMNKNIIVENNSTNLAVSINNYNSTTDYNIFDLDYEISITDNSKFTVTLDGESSTNNIFSRTLTGNSAIDDSFNINFVADINSISPTEIVTLNIAIKSPYVKEDSIQLTLSLHAVTVTLKKMDFADTNSTITVYKGRTYTGLPTPTWTGHTFNGWYTAETGGSQVTTSTEVTTSSSTQTLYARWTSNLLVDFVNVGDYVDYEIYYDNVTTNGAGSYAPSTSSSYEGWRVLSVEGGGDNRYVRLITAGVPMTYRHPYNTSSSTVGKTSVTNLTTGFFSTTMNTSTATDNQFHRCGFKTSKSATTYITSTSSLSTLFKGNTYTQLSGTTPMVQSVTKDDLDDYIADIKNVASYSTANAEYLTETISDDDLFIIESQTSGSYAAYYLATVAETYYIWQVRFNAAVVYSYYEYGIRPVVSLKPETLKKGGSGTVSSPYTLAIN